jgi:hypothetical protein
LTQAAQSKGQTAALELGTQSQQSLQTLATALKESTAKLAAAQANLATAQGTGGSVEQGVALGQVQRQEAEVARLKAAMDAMRTSVEANSKALGDSFRTGADAIKKAAALATPQVEQAGQRTKDTIDKAATDVAAGAATVEQSTLQASGQMAGAVDRMGASVTGGMGQMSEQVAALAQSVAAGFSAMASQIAVAQQTANAALASAQTAQAQVRNTR